MKAFKKPIPSPPHPLPPAAVSAVVQVSKSKNENTRIYTGGYYIFYFYSIYFPLVQILCVHQSVVGKSKGSKRTYQIIQKSAVNI